MTVLTLSDIGRTGDFASEALFQTNILQSANTGTPWYSDDVDNPVGQPTGLADDAMQYFGIQAIRFPGGATNDVFADGMMIGGALPANVINMLTYAQANGISVDMVVPVETPQGLTRAEFLSQMTAFAAAVEQQFPGVVTSYELGNEYWGGREPLDASLEAVYGVNAAETALALDRGMDISGADADVFLQASGNLRGAYGNDPDLANGAIQDGFATVPGAMNVLDGVIRNNYWRDAELDGFENDSGSFAEDRGLEFNLTGDANAWEDWLGRDVKTMVGEYNLNRNIGFGEDAVDLGVHGASYLLEHMTNMIDAGVDIAFAWPIAHNTQNAYLYRDEDITTVTVHGIEIATNTTRAAMLDLMRQTIASHELVQTDWSYGDTASDVEVTLFEDADGGPMDGQGERIVFLSSRSPEAMTFTADLSSFVPDYVSVSAIAIHYAEDGGHLRDAVVRELPVIDPEGDAIFEVELQPYEVVEFIFVYETEQATQENEVVAPQPVPIAEEVILTDEADSFWGDDTDEIYFAHAGDDTIFARDGDDVVEGGDGHDFIRGGIGNDSVLGERGNDTLYGDTGDDYMIGGAGWDEMRGGYGNDMMTGGSGSDSLHGDHGNDRLFGHAGNDLMSGGQGGDLLQGGTGNDTLDGGTGNDRLMGGADADLFVFAPMHGHDRIEDFSVLAGDRIDLSGFGDILSIEDLLLSDPKGGSARQIGNDVVIVTDLDTTITLTDLNLSVLTADHFIF